MQFSILCCDIEQKCHFRAGEIVIGILITVSEVRLNFIVTDLKPSRRAVICLFPLADVNEKLPKLSEKVCFPSGLRYSAAPETCLPPFSSRICLVILIVWPERTEKLQMNIAVKRNVLFIKNQF